MLATIIKSEVAMQTTNEELQKETIDLEEFKKMSDVIVANRLSDDIRDVEDKIYTRDIFFSDS